jgi:protein SCO1/2/putative membrane protein
MNKTIWVLTSCVLWLTAARARAEVSPDALYAAPKFALTNQEAKPFGDGDLKGKVWVVDFVFTRCLGPCPLMKQKMVTLAQKVESPGVRFVSISVDPTYDTPAVLKKYAEQQAATDPRIEFLTGDARTIYELAEKGFKLTARPSLDGSVIEHDERFLLIDAQGGVRGIYHSNDPQSMEALAVDAAGLAAAVSGGASAKAWLGRFPVINASLNATSGVLLCIAMILIQLRRVRLHAGFMIAAVVTSGAFLASYITFHVMKQMAGSAMTVFPASPIKPFYLVILISHSILAVVIVPMVIVTLWRAWRRKWDRHRWIARPTFWLWLYVSVTGVVVYWMLYHLAPRIVAQT